MDYSWVFMTSTLSEALVKIRIRRPQQVIKVNDIIFRVDDNGIDEEQDILHGLRSSEALSLVRGPVGTWVDISLKRTEVVDLPSSLPSALCRVLGYASTHACLRP